MFARKTTVERINSILFEQQWHISGKTNAKVRYGLVRDGEVLSVMTFRKQYSEEWEIGRYCTKPGYRIVGGFSKLLKAFINDYNPTEIVTYLYKDLCPDYRDSVYHKNNFEFIQDSGPIMKYFNESTKEIKTRQHYQKHLLQQLFPDTWDPTKTEKQLLEENKIYQIHDSGNYKFIWRA